MSLNQSILFLLIIISFENMLSSEAKPKFYTGRQFKLRKPTTTRKPRRYFNNTHIIEKMRKFSETFIAEDVLPEEAKPSIKKVWMAVHEENKENKNRIRMMILLKAFRKKENMSIAVDITSNSHSSSDIDTFNPSPVYDFADIDIYRSDLF